MWTTTHRTNFRERVHRQGNQQSFRSYSQLFAFTYLHLRLFAAWEVWHFISFYIIYRCISSAIRLLFVVHLVDIFKTGMIVTVEIPDIRGVHSTILGEPEFCLFIGDDVVLSWWRHTCLLQLSSPMLSKIVLWKSITTERSWSMMKYDEIWWNMMTYDEIWWNMMNYDEICMLIQTSYIYIYICIYIYIYIYIYIFVHT